MKRPLATAGMRHVALNVRELEAAEHFFTALMGMQVEWRPDTDNVYLSSGNDNLALHRAGEGFTPAAAQQLDHIGFIIDQPGQVDAWYEFLLSNGVEMKSCPRTHRDGARSFYCVGPEGLIVQVIYHPPLATGQG